MGSGLVAGAEGRPSMKTDLRTADLGIREVNSKTLYIGSLMNFPED